MAIKLNNNASSEEEPRQTHKKNVLCSLAIIVFLCFILSLEVMSSGLWSSNTFTITAAASVQLKQTNVTATTKQSYNKTIPDNFNFASFKMFLRDDFVPHQSSLEFVHITKSGGSAIEAAAARVHAKSWARCRDGFRKRQCRGAPPPRKHWPRSVTVPIPNRRRSQPWHIPHHWFHPDPFGASDTFAVVRNPYDRIVSEYYCPWAGFKPKQHPELHHDPTNMNEWIVARLNRTRQGCDHFLAQHYYIFNETGAQVTTHVLHYETLAEEFPILMAAYNLSQVVLSQQHVNSGRYNTTNENSKLTSANLTTETIQRINQNSGQTFELVGYRRVESAAEYARVY